MENREIKFSGTYTDEWREAPCFDVISQGEVIGICYLDLEMNRWVPDDRVQARYPHDLIITHELAQIQEKVRQCEDEAWARIDELEQGLSELRECMRV